MRPRLYPRAKLKLTSLVNHHCDGESERLRSGAAVRFHLPAGGESEGPAERKAEAPRKEKTEPNSSVWENLAWGVWPPESEDMAPILVGYSSSPSLPIWLSSRVSVFA